MISKIFQFNYFDKMLELLYLIFQKCFRCCWRQHIIRQLKIDDEETSRCVINIYMHKRKLFKI